MSLISASAVTTFFSGGVYVSTVLDEKNIFSPIRAATMIKMKTTYFMIRLQTGFLLSLIVYKV